MIKTMICITFYKFANELLKIPTHHNIKYMHSTDTPTELYKKFLTIHTANMHLFFPPIFPSKVKLPSWTAVKEQHILPHVFSKGSGYHFFWKWGKPEHLNIIIPQPSKSHSKVIQKVNREQVTQFFTTQITTVLPALYSKTIRKKKLVTDTFFLASIFNRPWTVSISWWCRADPFVNTGEGNLTCLSSPPVIKLLHNSAQLVMKGWIEGAAHHSHHIPLKCYSQLKDRNWVHNHPNLFVQQMKRYRYLQKMSAILRPKSIPINTDLQRYLSLSIQRKFRQLLKETSFLNTLKISWDEFRLLFPKIKIIS